MLKCYTFLDENDKVLGYWHTRDEKEMPERCRLLSEELGCKVFYFDGYIEE